MAIRNVRLVNAVSLLTLVAIFFGSNVQMVLGQRAIAAQQTTGIIVTVDREQRQLLVQAERAIENGRFADASLILGDILRDPEVNDYFLNPVDENGPQPSLKSVSERMIGDLPKAGREAYELQYGGQAKRMLAEALAKADEKTLADVTRMYFHTDSGYKATMLLGRMHLDRGEFLASAMTFDRLLAVSRAAEKFEPSLSILSALSWRRSGNDDRATEVLARLKATARKKTFTVGGEELKMFASNADAFDWLEEVGGKPGIVQGAEKTRWVMFRGDPARNAQSGGGMPVASIRWAAQTGNFPDDDRSLKSLAENYEKQRLAAITTLQPLAVADTIIMRNAGIADRVVALDFNTGKRIWEFPPMSEEPEVPTTNDVVNQNRTQKAILGQRVWEDAVFGQITSDGERVFIVDDLTNTKDKAFGGRNQVIRGVIQVNRHYASNTNTLTAVSLKQEGSLLWENGGKVSNVPELKGAFFLGAPLPLVGRLYALVEIDQEIRLVVMKSETGELLWSQQLGRIESRGITNDAVRRLAGSSPSFADGVLVCPTSAGTLIGVELSTHRLLWGYNYLSSTASGLPNQFQRVPRSKPIGERWIDATAAISNGKVVFTPVETDELHCIDLLTGEQAWRPLERGDGQYVACIHDGNIIIVGKNSVRSVALDTGEDSWEEPVQLPGLVSGRGYRSGDFYTIPTAANIVVRINLRTAEITQTLTTDNVLGNLVAYKDAILSHNYDTLTSFRQDAPLRDEVRKRLKANPRDPWALTRQAELMVQDGKSFAALTPLRTAYEVDPKNADTQNLLISTLLSSLRENFVDRKELVTEVKSLIRTPKDQAELLRIVAVGAQLMGETERAFNALVQLASLQPETDGEFDTADMELIDGNLYLRRDRWVQRGLTRLYEKANAKQKQTMNATMTVQAKVVLASQSTEKLQNFRRFFAEHPAADEVSLVLAERLTKSREFAQADFILRDLASRPASNTRYAAMAALARLAEEANDFAEASAMWRQLQDEASTWKSADNKTAEELANEAIGRRPEIRTAAAPSLQWKRGDVVVEQSGDSVSQQNVYQRIYPISVRSSSPDRVGYRLSLDQTRNAVIGYDKFGKEQFRANLKQQGNRRYYSSNMNLLHARWAGNLLIVSLGTELVAIDTIAARNNEDVPVLWRTDLTDSVLASNGVPTVQRVIPSSVSNPWGLTLRIPTDSQRRLIGATSPVSSQGICYTHNDSLFCVDPTTGGVIWERIGIEFGSDLSGDGRHVVVHQPSGKWLIYDAADGGLIAAHAIPEGSNSLVNRQGYGLLWRQDGGRLLMSSFNGLTGETVWTQDFAVGSKASLVEEDEVAVMEPDGSFKLFAFADAKPRVATTLSPEKILLSVHVIRSATDYLVAVSRPNVVNKDMIVAAAPAGDMSPLIYGRLYSFDRRTGESNWQTAAEIDRFGMPLEQPTNSPVVAFLRHVTPSVSRGPRRTQSSVLLLDRRDGSMIFQRDDIPAMTGQWRLEAQPALQQVEVQIQTKTIVVKFTDDEAPPLPPVQTGMFGGDSSGKNASVVKSISRAIIGNVAP